MPYGARGCKADDLAARLAALAPELTKLNQGAGQHGVPETLERADRVAREAEAVRAEAERLPERAAEIDHRLVSLRTRAQALTTRAGQVEPVLSELRRRFAAACWQDLQHVPDQAGGERPAGRAEADGGAGRARRAALAGRHGAAVDGAGAAEHAPTRRCPPPGTGCGG